MKSLIVSHCTIGFWVCLFLAMAAIGYVLRLHYLDYTEKEKCHGKPDRCPSKANNFFALGFRLFREKHK